MRRYLTETERANGFANRFLWLLVRRSKLRPEGEAVPDAELAPLVDDLRRVVAFARTAGHIERDAEARGIWAAVYPTLGDEHPGLAGAILNRAEAHALRLSILYAVLDASPVIRPAHLYAALALWDYAEASALRIFSSRPGSPVADRILETLRPRGRLAQTEIYRLFKGRRRAEEIHEALALLEARGLVRHGVLDTVGRPVTWWEAIP